MQNSLIENRKIDFSNQINIYEIVLSSTDMYPVQHSYMYDSRFYLEFSYLCFVGEKEDYSFAKPWNNKYVKI